MEIRPRAHEISKNIQMSDDRKMMTYHAHGDTSLRFRDYDEHKETPECGFDRNASHSEDRYVCTCGWRDEHKDAAGKLKKTKKPTFVAEYFPTKENYGS